MQTIHKLAMVSLLIGALGLPAAMPFANAQQQQSVQGTVEIIGAPQPTCGLSLPAASLNYGSLAYTEVSLAQKLTLGNPATSEASAVSVKGSDWARSGIVVMPASATHYSFDPGIAAYDGMNQLPGSVSTFTTLGPQQTVDSFWMLRADLMDRSFTGPASQTVDFIVECIAVP